MNNHNVFLGISITVVTALGVYLAGCSSTDMSVYDEGQSEQNLSHVDENGINFEVTVSLNNKAAYVTSQCYTKTIDNNGNIHNPCFTCHINSKEPNYVNDSELHLNNDFGEYTRINRFTNLFEDRTDAVAAISDEEILDYVKEDNYKDANGNLKLAQRLNNVPSVWDVNENGKWDGYIPDCYFNFDNEGFDKDKSGNYTGWRAFGYYPILGTFWPTNGSTDDVLIRLPRVFRENEAGVFDLTVYKINLAIVEALIKEKDINLETEVDESSYGVDLDQDGKLGMADTIVFQWIAPTYNSATGKIENFSMSYVGRAKSLLTSNEYLIAPGLYPKKTEFLHSVRYIDIDESNTSVKMAKRMKELRYGVKVNWNTYPQLSNATDAEIKEKDAFPNRLRTIIGNTEQGLQTSLGWVYQGFIEDAQGELRPQNYEETQYCIGCHSGIGAIKDSTFVFGRKFEYKHFRNGWYHWSQDPNGFKGITEPLTKDGREEYQLYLALNHAGDEFRANDEVLEKFFDQNGTLKEEEAAKISEDISYLIYPSAKRALELNKAYKVIVDEQSYIYGRDAHVKPLSNVHQSVEIGQPTGIEKVEF
ncbi:hypothetical protein PGH07_05820 [Sulfurovum sp. zt1-1]|uniref:Lipoprotein n=1 Tax=Sulfurovum zhangzhouensis TaxID=3019067 RepID=A0ABT7QXX2_9BACT|nr:hypothetical protein [Sulfurovum zhangzhouensis]MDM5271685.1 hypothetical protein [Sulfurovum zhangzhouensis]